MKIKICGIKTLEEGLSALEAGADLLGFNFYPPSPRYLAPRDCARLVAVLQDRGLAFRAVGIFVNQPAASIRAILEDCGLQEAQLSGDEPPEELAALSGLAGEPDAPGQRALQTPAPQTFAFKAIRPRGLSEALALAERYARSGQAPALLVDAFGGGQYGGSGHTGDWSAAAGLAARYPILLAGGLHPGNVAQALSSVHPWGVDVASGVEASPGRKDPQKMAAFVRAVRQYEEGLLRV
jgi:phosphoribosylanthranilate isomerase